MNHVPSQPPTLDAQVFCATTIDIVRAHVPTIVGNLAATDDLIAQVPGPARERLRPHVAELVTTGSTLGRRLLRAVDLGLHTLALRSEEVDLPAAEDLRAELLGLADELSGLLVRLSCVEARLDRVEAPVDTPVDTSADAPVEPGD